MGITLRDIRPNIRFDKEFIERIPELEKEMVVHGIDPSDFVIEKEEATFRTYGAMLGIGAITGTSYNYTVIVNNRSFTVTMPTDAQFLEYFYKICFPSNAEEHSQHKLANLLNRFERWLAEDPLSDSPPT